jgi:hypothetical protein
MRGAYTWLRIEELINSEGKSIRYGNPIWGFGMMLKTSHLKKSV